MAVTSILTIINKTVDLLLVWAIYYYLLKSLQNNTKLSLIFKGILLVTILKILADFLNLVTIGLFLEYLIMWGPLALIIIFQPEIRTILEHIGRRQLLVHHKVLTVDERERVIFEIVSAMEQMKKERVGALIVLERESQLDDYINKAKKIYGDVSSDLIQTIFFPNNPLHDGAIIIEGDKISCAGAVFPTSSNLKGNKRLGTRHRAAVGITEENDCIALVVSEETGYMSIAMKGELYYNLSGDDIRMTLIEEMRPKKNNDEKKEEEIIYEENK